MARQARDQRDQRPATSDTQDRQNDSPEALSEELSEDLAEVEREQRAAFEATVEAQHAQQNAQDEAQAREARLKEMREQDAEQVLERYRLQLEKLQTELETRRAEFETLEAEEQERANTPLSYDPIVTSCNFATVTYPAGESIPRFDFPGLKCIRGKTRPDQDCRTCVEVKLIPYGLNLPPHRRRYLRHGLVFPLRTNQEADAIINVLTTLGIRPLRNIRAELDAIENAISVLKQQMAEQQGRG